MRNWFLVSVVLATGCTVLAPGDHLDEAHRGDPRHVDATTTVRVVSWNIETLGPVGSTEYDAAQQILAHLDADVVLLQEVQWEFDAWVIDDFAADAGYPYVHDGWPVSFGTDTQLILSRYPMNWQVLLDHDELSDDPDARDTTRAVPVAGLDIDGVELVVASTHLKAGSLDADEFRRTVDAHRAVQAVLPFDPATDRVLLAGDLNDDLHDPPNFPRTWTTLPDGLLSSYHLGDDLFERLQTEGLPNDVFTPFEEAGLVLLDAEQLSGGDATRPQSGRRLDYIAVSPLLAEGAVTEVYDTFDRHLAGLPKPGPEPTLSTLTAADHLPVVVDLAIGTPSEPTEPTEPTEPQAEALPVAALGAGELVVTEVLPNPDGCSDRDGEWVEVLNRSGEDVDLQGLQLCDGHSCGEVRDAGVLPAGAVAVFARSHEDCGVPVDGVFDAALSNGGDEVVLVGAVTLDAVSYTGADADVSWVFDDEGSCVGPLGGTPGEAVDCDGAPLPRPEPEPEPEPWTVDDVPVGALRLTEVMPNPSACSDDDGEWVEVHNTGDVPVALAGLVLADNRGPVPVDTAHVLPGGERAVFARSAAACDPPQVDGTFSAALSNGGDDVALQRPDGDVLDAMTYPDAPSGEVWVRHDDGWCLSGSPTPGKADAACD